jgi:hypothetical protein
MLKSQFPIKEGTLEFFEDYIEIRDKWKSARFAYKYQPYLLIAYPLTIVLFQKVHDEIWWLLTMLLAIFAIIKIYRFFNAKKRIFKNQLPIDQIAEVILERYSYDRLSAKFHLKNRTYRLVDLDFDRFWKADFEQALISNGIAVESI